MRIIGTLQQTGADQSSERPLARANRELIASYEELAVR